MALGPLRPRRDPAPVKRYNPHQRPAAKPKPSTKARPKCAPQISAAHRSAFLPMQRVSALALHEFHAAMRRTHSCHAASLKRRARLNTMHPPQFKS